MPIYPVFIPSLVILSLLLGLNSLVLVLYFFEYRKNKRTLRRQDELFFANKEAIESLHKALNVDTKVLDAVASNVDGIKQLEDAKHKAWEIVQHVSAQSEKLLTEMTTMEATLATNVAKQQGEVEQAYLAIIQQAHDQASQMLKPATSFQADLQTKLGQAFDEAVTMAKASMANKIADFLSNYQKALLETQSEHIKELQTTNKDVDTHITQLTQQFITEMKERIVTLGTERQTFMEKELATIQANLEDYKKAQLVKIESNIYEILARAAESVIGKAVSLDTHQELIIKALEQAKREGVFI